MLLAEAQADLDGEGVAGEADVPDRETNGPDGAADDPAVEADGRTALVARRFVERELADLEARGITSGDRFPIEHFDAIVRYERVEPEAIAEPFDAAD